MARERLDKVLLDRGLVTSRERGRALIMAGKVRVNGIAESKPGTLVAAEAEVTLLEDAHPYVSRGGLKLVKGLDTFAIDPTGMIALDIGASTGGFTDVLLRRGAKVVYAIDVGYGQLAWSLRQDPRVVVLERANIRNLDFDLVPEAADLAVIDVSFISLTLVLPRVRELMREPYGKPIVALVKPQFEVGRDQVGKGGVVRDETARRGAVDKVRAWAIANSFTAHEDVESPITGPAGNVEYLLLLRTAELQSQSADPAEHAESPPSVNPAEHAESPPSVNPAEHAESPPSVNPAEHAESPPSVNPAEHAESPPSVNPAEVESPRSAEPVDPGTFSGSSEGESDDS